MEHAGAWRAILRMTDFANHVITHALMGALGLQTIVQYALSIL